MRIYFTFLLQLFISATQLFSQALPKEFEMGKTNEQWKTNLTDISNPQSWEETRYKYNKPVTLFGQEALATEVAFWNKRLYEVKITLPLESWELISSGLDKQYGKPWSIDTTTSEKSGSWGDLKNGVSVYQIDGLGTLITFLDENQKEFHFTDLFHGILLYIFLTIIGLFVLNMLIGWLLTSWCKRCKTFNMKMQSISISTDKDYSTDILGSASMHHDKTYKYKCSKCGHLRKDKYSGFWSFIRSKD